MRRECGLLQEPLLQSQDIIALTSDAINNPWEALTLLSKVTNLQYNVTYWMPATCMLWMCNVMCVQPSHFTLEYVCRTVALLLPLSGEYESAVVQRLLSAFTHQHVYLDMNAVVNGGTTHDRPVRRSLKDTLAPALSARLIYFIACLLHDSYIDWEFLYSKHTSNLSGR